MEKIDLVLPESGKELRMASAITELLPMVVQTVYFCVAPVQETAKRKVNELRAVHLNRQYEAVLPPSLSHLPCFCQSDLFEVLFDTFEGAVQGRG